MQCIEHEKEKESGTYTYFIKALHAGPDLATVGGYVSLAYGIRGGKVKIASLRSATQVRASLKLDEGAGVRYTVVSLTDAKFSPHSLISRLTEKQQRVLIAAYTLGHYDVPKKISLVQLAESSTFHVPRWICV